MAVDPISSSTPTSTVTSNPAGYTAKAKQTLDSDDFLQLLTVQMQNQDPLSPMDNTEYISQMASFSSLAQMNQLTKSFSLLQADQSRTTANSYIGKTVTVTSKDAESGTVTGQVTGVDFSESDPRLCIDGKYYALSSVTYVAGTTSTGTGTTTSTTP